MYIGGGVLALIIIILLLIWLLQVSSLVESASRPGQRVALPTTDDADDSDGGTTDDDSGAGAIEVGVVEGALASAHPSQNAEAGNLTFRFNNTEAVPHDFVVVQNGERSPEQSSHHPTTARSCQVELETGEYSFICR